MSDKKIIIHEILDMFNEEVGYIGLDNTGKTTEERDDVITRKTFNNWVTEYNKTHPDERIKSRKRNQYYSEYLKSDIEKLIKTYPVKKRLKDAYLRETEPLFNGYEELDYTSKRVSKRYKNKLNEMYNEGIEDAIKSRMNSLINEIIESHFTLKLNGNVINTNNFIDKNKVVTEFIDLEKVEEEAFKMEDNYYGIPEYDSTGDIVAVHHQGKRPKTSYFLKKHNKTI